MDSPSTSSSSNVRRSRRLAGLAPNQEAAGETSAGETGPQSVEDTEEAVGGEDTESEPSSSDEGSTCQLPLGYRGSMPVMGESYCSCPRKSGDLDCMCGEEETEYFEWHWDEESKSQASQISEDGKTARFHVDYSCGTAAVRGNKAMTADQHFWEVKMTTPVYGTDMMVGVGTSEVRLDLYRNMFCSFLGRDSESWGLSYNGLIHHGGEVRPYATLFGQGSIIGVHLDMWHGTLSFYKNRQPLGLAYHGLQGKTLFPMVCSTAARSGMKIIKACSFSTSLQFLCCQVLRSYIPNHLSVTDSVMLPPGLKSFLLNNLSWLLRPVKQPTASSCSKTKHSVKHGAGHGHLAASSLSTMSPILSRASFCRARFSENDRKRQLETSEASSSDGAGPSGVEPERKKMSVQKDLSGKSQAVQSSSKCGHTSVAAENDKTLDLCKQRTNSSISSEDAAHAVASTSCTYSSSCEISTRRPATSERNESADSAGSSNSDPTSSKAAARVSSLETNKDSSHGSSASVTAKQSVCETPGVLSQKCQSEAHIKEQKPHVESGDEDDNEPVAKKRRLAM